MYHVEHSFHRGLIYQMIFYMCHVLTYQGVWCLS